MNDDETTALGRDLVAENRVLLRNLQFRDQVIVWIDAGGETQVEHEGRLAEWMMRTAMKVFTKPH